MSMTNHNRRAHNRVMDPRLAAVVDEIEAMRPQVQLLYSRVRRLQRLFGKLPVCVLANIPNRRHDLSPDTQA